MKAWTIVAYTYDADVHHTWCAEKRFGAVALANDTATDSEGNKVHAVFASDDSEDGSSCGTCNKLIDD
jgi:hypothetical protein